MRLVGPVATVLAASLLVLILTGDRPLSLTDIAITAAIALCACVVAGIFVLASNDIEPDAPPSLTRALQNEKEAGKRKTEYLASLSHELRTPLSVISKIPSALLEDYREGPVWECERCGATFVSETEEERTATSATCPEDGGPMTRTTQILPIDLERHRRSLRLLDQATQQLVLLVDDLLDLSKLESGRVTLTMASVTVADVVDQVRGSLDEMAAEKNVQLHWDLNANLRLSADRVKLGQVLVNLVGNAIKFTPAAGSVTVSVRLDPLDTSVIRWIVSDTGIGVAPEDREIIFESFRQARSGANRDGTGLGLAITKRIVELHEGSIRVESELG
ncbi:MAG: ATP-binding protein, partial [Myxococcota bacterium]